MFLEKIKRDPDRVDIAKIAPADTSGDDLTGRCLKIDKSTGSSRTGFNSAYPPPNNGPLPAIQFEYPDYSEILPQSAYIQSYIDSFEQALHGPDLLNHCWVTGITYINSFIDYFLINEFSKNVDGS